jgi:hypothetical protein
MKVADGDSWADERLPKRNRRSLLKGFQLLWGHHFYSREVLGVSSN